MSSGTDVHLNMVKSIIADTQAQVDEIGDKASHGGGWMSAIAKAMGKAMGIQAARVVALSNAIAENATQIGKGDTKDDAKLAAIGQALNTQFQAASQELSTTSNAFATAIKALGEANTTMARKQ